MTGAFICWSFLSWADCFQLATTRISPILTWLNTSSTLYRLLGSSALKFTNAVGFLISLLITMETLSTSPNYSATFFNSV